MPLRFILDVATNVPRWVIRASRCHRGFERSDLQGGRDRLFELVGVRFDARIRGSLLFQVFTLTNESDLEF